MERLEERYTPDLVKCIGICSSFEDATLEVQKFPGDKFVFSLASTLNSLPKEYVPFLQKVKFAKRMMISQQIPIFNTCVDGGYHTDSYERFIWQGLERGNKLINCQEFIERDWEISCAIKSTEEYWDHHFVVTPRKGTRGKKRFKAFASIKYTDEGFKRIARRAGFKIAKSNKHDGTGMSR